MPHKHNANRRHRTPKARYRVTNWARYEAGLRQRGSLTVWFSEEAIAAWRAAPRRTPGGQERYSPLAIETALTLRALFRLPLRQTEGLIGSILQLLALDLDVPDHSTLSRRAKTLAVTAPPRSGSGPLHLLVDSTGLRFGGSGEWLIEKHGARRRSWRKLHLLVDARTHEIVASELTARDVDDASQVRPLLGQVAGPIASFTGDGAYDTMATDRSVVDRQPADPPAIIIPPRSTAVPSPTADRASTQRDRHHHTIQERGRMAWQRESGYNLRSRVEVAIGRYKQILGSELRARTLLNQKTEAAIAVKILNRMTQAGMPISVRIA